MISEINKIKIKNYAILILLGVLIFALIRGCQNNKIQLGQVNQLIEKHNADSIKMFNDSVDFANRMQYAEGKLELNYSSVLSLTDSLRTANDRITKLRGRYKPITPSVDTSVTLVDNSFINDCADCFNELEHDKELVKYYVNRVDSLKSTLHIKSKIQEQRIQQLNEEKKSLSAAFNDCVTISKEQQNKNKPRRKVFLTFTGISQFNVYTIGAGAGLLYMDKRERVFGGNAYATNIGPIYTASISFPLSFKKLIK